jgi:hypothetical protein
LDASSFKLVFELDSLRNATPADVDLVYCYKEVPLEELFFEKAQTLLKPLINEE